MSSHTQKIIEDIIDIDAIETNNKPTNPSNNIPENPHPTKFPQNMKNLEDIFDEESKEQKDNSHLEINLNPH